MSLNEPSRFSILFHSFCFNRILGPLYRKYARSFGLRGDERLLDFGCGSGALSRHVAPMLAAGGGSVVCLDQSAAWLERAKKTLRRYDNVEFMQGDVRSLEIEAGSFDAVAIHFVLHDVEVGSRQESLRSLARALKPGGRLFIREPIRPSHGMPAGEVRRLMGLAGLEEAWFFEGKLFPLGRVYVAVLTKPGSESDTTS